MPKDVSFIQEYKLPTFGGAHGFIPVLNCLPIFIVRKGCSVVQVACGSKLVLCDSSLIKLFYLCILACENIFCDKCCIVYVAHYSMCVFDQGKAAAVCGFVFVDQTIYR